MSERMRFDFVRLSLLQAIVQEAIVDYFYKNNNQVALDIAVWEMEKVACVVAVVEAWTKNETFLDITNEAFQAVIRFVERQVFLNGKSFEMCEFLRSYDNCDLKRVREEDFSYHNRQVGVAEQWKYIDLKMRKSLTFSQMIELGY